MARDRRPRDDDEDEDDRTRRKRRPAEEDEEDEGEPPRRKARARDDDEDEEDDRPRRRRKKKPAGMSKGLLFGLIGGGVALVGVVVLLIVLLGGSSPKSVMGKVIRAVKAGDYGTMFDNMSAKMQQQRAFSGPGLPGMNVTATDPRGRFIETMKAVEKMGGNQFDKQTDATIVGETITGDTAVVRMRNPHDGREVDVPFIKENGRWKLNGF